MTTKIPKTYRIYSKHGNNIAVSTDNILAAWVLADAILRPDVDRNKYPMNIYHLKLEGYYAREVDNEYPFR